VRSQSAHFIIDKDAEELLDGLRRHYVTQLLDLGADLTDSEALSLLLWGDEGHAQQAEEMVAWMQHDRNQPAATASGAPADAEAAPDTEAPAADDGAPAADATEGTDEAEEAPAEPEEAPVEPEEAPVEPEEASAAAEE